MAVKVNCRLNLIIAKNLSKNIVKGYVTMENCTMRGASSTDGAKNDEEDVGSWKGFYVAAHSKLNLKGCNIINFDVGLRVRATGKVSLTASDVTLCNIGILVGFNKVYFLQALIIQKNDAGGGKFNRSNQ